MKIVHNMNSLQLFLSGKTIYVKKYSNMKYRPQKVRCRVEVRGRHVCYPRPIGKTICFSTPSLAVTAGSLIWNTKNIIVPTVKRIILQMANGILAASSPSGLIQKKLMIFH
jgi:hypothetical protein